MKARIIIGTRSEVHFANILKPARDEVGNLKSTLTKWLRDAHEQDFFMPVAKIGSTEIRDVLIYRPVETKSALTRNCRVMVGITGSDLVSAYLTQQLCYNIYALSGHNDEEARHLVSTYVNIHLPVMQA